MTCGPLEKVFPASLNNLLKINAELCNYIGPPGTPKSCYTCKNTEARLSKCGGCDLYSYCNKVRSGLNCLCPCGRGTELIRRDVKTRPARRPTGTSSGTSKGARSSGIPISWPWSTSLRVRAKLHSDSRFELDESVRMGFLRVLSQSHRHRRMRECRCVLIRAWLDLWRGKQVPCNTLLWLPAWVGIPLLPRHRHATGRTCVKGNVKVQKHTSCERKAEGKWIRRTRAAPKALQYGSR